MGFETILKAFKRTTLDSHQNGFYSILFGTRQRYFIWNMQRYFLLKHDHLLLIIPMCGYVALKHALYHICVALQFALLCKHVFQTRQPMQEIRINRYVTHDHL